MKNTDCVCLCGRECGPYEYMRVCVYVSARVCVYERERLKVLSFLQHFFFWILQLF